MLEVLPPFHPSHLKLNSSFTLNPQGFAHSEAAYSKISTVPFLGQMTLSVIQFLPLQPACQLPTSLSQLDSSASC